MDPLTLVTKVFLREHLRMAQWLSQWFTAGEVDAIASQCLANLWFDAARGQATQMGPYAHLYKQAEPSLRRQLEERGRYLPVWAIHALPVPTQGEIEELVRVYCTVALAVDLAGVGLAERGVVARAIRRAAPDGSFYGHTTWYAADDSVLVETRDRLVAALLIEKPASEDQAARVADLWTREVDRTHRWMSVHQHRTSGVSSVRVQQDHDPGVSG